MAGSSPHAKTVARKAGQGAEPGRPVVVPYRNLTMSQDRSRTEGYRFLWQKMDPPVVQRVKALMSSYEQMPEGLKPKSLQAIQARQHRRDH